jgi:hypothetical protein
MSYVPTLCLQCRRVHLVSVAAAQSSERACASCGARTRIVPGCSFADAERDAFEELSAIVAEGALSTLEARAHAAGLERALAAGSYGAALEKLSERLPGILPSQVAAGRNASALRGMAMKLKTVLEALATAANGSGEYATFQGAAAQTKAGQSR